MDPQHRVLLEVAWEALENAGIPPDSLVGTKTGVFLGICTNDYSLEFRITDAVDPYMATGNSFSVAAGRLSYILGLQGPNLALDTGVFLVSGRGSSRLPESAKPRLPDRAGGWL